MNDDPEFDFSSNEWKSGPGVGLVLVLSMAALVIAGGLVLYLGPDAIFPVIQRYPSLYGF